MRWVRYRAREREHEVIIGVENWQNKNKRRVNNGDNNEELEIKKKHEKREPEKRGYEWDINTIW